VLLDETEALRRRVRFVWTAPTSVGVCGRALSAVAAAAAESDGLDSRRLKAETAAVAALGFAVAVVRGCMLGRDLCVSLLSSGAKQSCQQERASWKEVRRAEVEAARRG